MTESLVLPLHSPAAIPITRSRYERCMVLLATSTCLFMLVLNIFFRESYTGDEGFYGVTALNMLHSRDYVLRPSYFPGGDFVADQDAFAHPPFNSYLYALSLWFSRGSLAGPELLNGLSFALLLYFAFRGGSLFV